MAALVLLGLTGCFHLDVEEIHDGRILLQVRDEATGALLGDVDVHVLGQNGEGARGTTNDAGCVGLSFRAPRVAMTSGRWVPGWVLLRFTAPGYAPLEMPCGVADFVETSRIRVLTRGVTLRRAA
jgi:hypothetical protein